MFYRLVMQNHVEGVAATSWDIRPPAVVGREPGTDVCIDHDSISRKHCQFSLNTEGALVLKDLDSLNGTYVDEQRIRQTILMPGQLVQFGAIQVQVEFDVDSPATRPPAKGQGSVYATRPMETFQPVPLPPEKPWWKKLFGG